MAIAIGSLQSIQHVQESTRLLPGSNFLNKRSTRNFRQINRARLSTSPTCALQISKLGSRDEVQQIDLIFSGKSTRSLEIRIRELNEELRVEKFEKVDEEWESARGRRMRAELINLATQASDRTEMHSVLATQRDNWSVYFHSTITLTSVFSAASAAIHGAGHQAPGLCVVATILGLGTAALMALVSKFQPSQLAEEQRQASRFFKRLTVEVEATLDECPTLCQAASPYLKDKFNTLHSLDSGFPLPLTPVVLEKFPQVIGPSVLSGSSVSLEGNPIKLCSPQPVNGWTPETEEQLQRASSLLHSSDIPASVEVAKTLNHMNKVFSVASPVLAFTGALLNMIPGMINFPAVGPALMVCALFTHSLSHGLQLGALYETHRNIAGYYSDVERSIETALRLPVEERQDGTLFLGKVAMQLGRDPAASPLIACGQEKAGVLF